MGLSQAKPAGGNPLSLLMVHYQKQNCNLYQVQSKVKRTKAEGNPVQNWISSRFSRSRIFKKLYLQARWRREPYSFAVYDLFA